MNAVADVVGRKKAVIFDLFHTLTAAESTWGDGLPFTCDMLGIDRDAWHDQLQLHSRSRLAGHEKDPFRIVSQMARAIDPAIADDTIRASVANRILRFEAALMHIPDANTAVLQWLRAQGSRLFGPSFRNPKRVRRWPDGQGHLGNPELDCLGGLS